MYHTVCILTTMFALKVDIQAWVSNSQLPCHRKLGKPQAMRLQTVRASEVPFRHSPDSTHLNRRERLPKGSPAEPQIGARPFPAAGEAKTTYPCAILLGPGIQMQPGVATVPPGGPASGDLRCRVVGQGNLSVHRPIRSIARIIRRAALGNTHRINLRKSWRGRLWQERLHSFPMGERYLQATVAGLR